LEFQKLLQRRGLIGAAAVAAAVTAAMAASGVGASAAGSPVLQSLTYTATGPGGGLRLPVGVSATNGNVYVSNTSVNVLAELANGSTTAVAGSLEGYGDHGDGGKAASATLYQPGGTAEDANGDIFIADSGDNLVREITPDGVMHRFAGNGSAKWDGLGSDAAHLGLDHPEAVAVDPGGDVFIADTYANRVIEVQANGKPKLLAGTGQAGYQGDRGPAADAELSMPTGLAVDQAGDVYIADSANNVIRRVDAKTKTITTVAGDYAAAQASDGLGGFAGDGGPATSARLNDPQGVALDGAGDLFIADTFNNAIREVTPAGTISTVVNAASANGGIPTAGGETSGAAATASKLNTPYGVAVDQGTDVLYIADTHNSKIAAVTGLAQSGDAADPTAPAQS
jgi:sugar lactone lactonase YvrE